MIESERLARLGSGAAAARDVAADDRAARDAAIVDADAAGVPLRTIARDVGLSPSYTQRIIVRETARRQAAAELQRQQLADELDDLSGI